MNEILEDLKPIGRNLFDIQAKYGINSLDVWASSEPGVIMVQYYDRKHRMQIERVDCAKEERMELEEWE